MKYEWSNTLEEFLLALQPWEQEPETSFGLSGAERILLQMHRPEQGEESEERKAA